jgi:putative ABC transport system permease protein
VRLLVTESLMIAAAGGLLGVCAAFAVLGLMVERAGPSGRFFEFSIEPVILLQSLVITVLSGIVAGLGPALFETRRLQGNPMRGLTSSERVRQRWRHALVALEITVTVALLVVAATMLDGYRRSFRADLGFRTERLVAIRVENGAGVQTARLLDLLETMPGVASAAASTSIPYAGFGPLQNVAADASGASTVKTERAAIGPMFFATLGVPLRAGRGFTDQDGGTAPIAIVNETLAGRLWPGGSPVGKRLWIRETAYDVVGVVADYRNSAFQNRDWDPKVYVPFADRGNDVKSVRFLVRSSGDAVAVARALRREIPKAATGNVVSSAYTLDEIIAVAGQEILVGTAPLVPLVATGMLLTAAGIYGVLAFAIARRSKELAVRVAIGATGRDLVRLVAEQSVRLVAIGTICGVGATYGLVRVMRASGGAGSIFDPSWTAFIVPAAVIVVVGALASWIPSRRALDINPAEVLRTT